MPGLSVIKILGNVKFLSHNLKLPVDWKQPQGDPDAGQYGDAIKPAEKVAVPSLIPPWFMPHNTTKQHVKSCDDVGKEFKKLHDDCLDAVVFAHNMWKLQAMLKDLKIMAVSAIGSPGCLSGPELEPLIKMAPMVAAYMGNYAKYRDAVAKGVSKAFKEWQDQVMVPGLPWYPAFAAFPGPMGPPMPNIPTPLIALPSSKVTNLMMPDTMKNYMVDALDSGLKDKDSSKQHVALFDAIATVLAMAFTMWLPSQQAMLVLGQGPIPTFAPPYVPVGPVMNGQNIPTPGHFMA